VAQPVAAGQIGAWRGEGVRLGQVLDALTELRRCGQRTATRATVTNLVIVAGDDRGVDRACEAVHNLGRRHPGRNVVLLAMPEAEPSGIDAEILLHGSVLEGHAVWSEDIRLTVRGAHAGHLESLIRPLVLPDLPVAMWFVRGLPEPGDPLVRAATTIIVDGDTVGDDLSMAALARLAARRTVFDLCWERLRPWRQLLAGLFEVPAARPYLDGVQTVEVEGGRWATALLGGWVTSRLGLPAAAVRRTAAATTALRLVAAADGRHAEFTVEEVRGDRGATVVRASTSLHAPGGRDDRLSVPDEPLAWALGEVLTRTGRDRFHGQAMQAAVALVGLGAEERISGAPAAS
jgi:glucose-6-phosphate dehydrogenase assembly protein OpcA